MILSADIPSRYRPAGTHVPLARLPSQAVSVPAARLYLIGNSAPTLPRTFTPSPLSLASASAGPSSGTTSILTSGLPNTSHVYATGMDPTTRTLAVALPASTAHSGCVLGTASWNVTLSPRPLPLIFAVSNMNILFTAMTVALRMDPAKPKYGSDKDWTGPVLPVPLSVTHPEYMGRLAGSKPWSVGGETTMLTSALSPGARVSVDGSKDTFAAALLMSGAEFL
ncbi:hypothetical protein MCOR20_011697 [Pyricularia oryzae]|nr:hypothetical protein MCOR20_011697 [Pyricularia oryzae]